ncbi:triacylglycerol lipase [Cooperia oncophora]
MQDIRMEHVRPNLQAILGGKCVDTGEYLGPPLTALVDTFVSVAGANHGLHTCLMPGFGELCNPVNGFTCTSKFLEDINAIPRYEGHHIFSIYSMQDEIIGYLNTCGSIAASIKGADKEFETFGGHNQVMVDSVPMQAKLIATHRADGSMRKRSCPSVPYNFTVYLS